MDPLNPSESPSLPASPPTETEPPLTATPASEKTPDGDHISLDRSRNTYSVSGTPADEIADQVSGARVNTGGDAVVLDRSSNLYEFKTYVGTARYSVDTQPYPRSAEYLPALIGSSQQQDRYIFKRLPETLSRSKADSLASFLASNRLTGHRKGITKYIGIDQIDNRFYLIRDYSNRECLIDVLDSAPFSDRVVESLVIQIAQNLGNHQPHGAIHPGNIFVDITRFSSQELRFGTVKLTDYFIDEIKNFLASLNQEFEAQYTSTVGLNPDYVPHNRSVQDRAVRDTYGLAAVAFELLTGRPTDFPELNVNTEQFPEFAARFNRRPDRNLVKSLTLVATGSVKTVAQLIDAIKGRPGNNRLKNKLFS